MTIESTAKTIACIPRIPVISIIVICFATPAFAAKPPGTQSGAATYFTYASCLREGTSGITASGKLLVDSCLWCALPASTAKTWNIKYGASIRVTNLITGRTVTVKYMDRGPGRKSQRAGTVIDLTLRAYKALGGSLKRGHIHITWKKVT